MMKHWMAILGATFLMGTSVYADDDKHEHDHSKGHEHSHDHDHGMKEEKHKKHKAEMIEAEVRKVMADRGRVSLKHGEIPSHEMPPMTMVFKVKDKAMLEGLEKGDSVRFTMDEDMVIQSIKRR